MAFSIKQTLKFCLKSFEGHSETFSNNLNNSILKQLSLKILVDEQDQKDLLNLPSYRVMNCYINCFHCRGQNYTEFQPSRIQLVSTQSWGHPIGIIRICRLMVEHLPGRPNYDQEWSIAHMWSSKLWCMMIDTKSKGKFPHSNGKIG